LNVLALGAHFDDVELGCGGAIAKHVANGDNVYVYTATLSGYQDPSDKVVREDSVAMSEAKVAMKVLGVSDLTCGFFRTFELEFVEKLNADIINIVEKRDIQLVYTHWLGDIHHDHIALAKASLHSCRHVKKMLMYRSNWYQSTTEFRGNFYIDISDHWETKRQAILAYNSEVSRTKYAWIDFFENEARNAGQRVGVDKAEVFEMVKWLVD